MLDNSHSEAIQNALDPFFKGMKESQDAHITDRLDRIEAKVDSLLELAKINSDAGIFANWDWKTDRESHCSESGVCNGCGDPNKVLCSRHAAEESEDHGDMGFESSEKN